MKVTHCILFTILTLTSLAQSPPFKKLKPIIVDLNNDKFLDTILLGSSLTDTISFNKISISICHFGKQTFLAKNNWKTVDSSFLAWNENAINSQHLFLLKAKDHSIILLFGYLDSAGKRDNFSIININKNKSKMIFDREENDINIELPISLFDFGNDGSSDLVFRNSFESYEHVDSLNADIGPYSPFFVYTIDDDFKLNKMWTKEYNEENYVFAGYEYSEKIKILAPRNGSQPRVVK